jgi:hypothetical protein
MGWTIGGSKVRFPAGAGNFSLLGPTQLIQWLLGVLSLGVNQTAREADHSPPSSAEFKECVKLYLHPPNTPSWGGDQLKHRDNFTLYLFIHMVL